MFRTAAGDRSRDYRDQFLRQDAAMIGPGGVGEWNGNNTGVSQGQRRSLNALTRMAPGDLVVLNVGRDVVTVGRVETEYAHNDGLGLTGHWDLHHHVRVKWADPNDKEAKKALGEPGEFPKIRGPRGTCCRLGGANHEVTEWAREVERKLDRANYWTRPLKDLDIEDRQLSKKELKKTCGKELLEVLAQAEDLWKALQGRGWKDPTSEGEAVALLVVPFLQALGWKPQNIAIEWKYVDVALFPGADREGRNCKVLIEVKRPGSGLVWARGQAFEYADRKGEFGVPKKTPILVTDGFVWVMYQDKGSPTPVGEIFLPQIRARAQGFLEKLPLISP